MKFTITVTNEVQKNCNNFNPNDNSSWKIPKRKPFYEP